MDKVQKKFDRDIERLDSVILDIDVIMRDLKISPWSMRKGLHLHSRVKEMLELSQKTKDRLNEFPQRANILYTMIQKVEKLYRILKDPFYDKFIKRTDLPSLKRDVIQLQLFKEDNTHRRDRLFELESDLIDIVEVFKDMDTLLDRQQDDLNIIDANIFNTNRLIKNADKELDKAESYYQQITKKRVLICLMGGTVGASLGGPVGSALGIKIGISSTIGLSIGSGVSYWLGR
jgi:hypothetical protein